MSSGATAPMITVPPAPGLSSNPGVKPIAPYSKINASPPEQPAQVHEISACVSVIDEMDTDSGVGQGGGLVLKSSRAVLFE